MSKGMCEKTSPYFSISFGNLHCPSFEEKELYAKHKMAVYGSTALYNRRRLYIKALMIGRNNSSSGKTFIQVERSACDVHFGLTFVNEYATL